MGDLNELTENSSVLNIDFGTYSPSTCRSSLLHTLHYVFFLLFHSIHYHYIKALTDRCDESKMNAPNECRR